MGGEKEKMGVMNKILILHGWAYSTEKWKNFIDLMKEENSSVELLKIPGLTEKLELVWNLDNYVEWLKRVVDKQKDKIILIGHSNGGRISLAFAAKYPNKISKLILIDSAGIYHNDLLIRLKRMLFKAIAKFGKKITNSGTLRKALYKFTREEDYKNASPIVRETMVNLITSDISACLTEIITPTLIIWGEFDKITPTKDSLLMHKLIKNSKLIIIKNARHSPQFTNTAEVVTKIYEYI